VRRLPLVVAVAGVLLGGGAAAFADDGLVLESVDLSPSGSEVSVVLSVPPAAVAAEPEAGDFAVLIDGERVPVRIYAAVADPMQIVVAIDTSGSMAGQPLQDAIAGIGRFVEGLPPDSDVAVLSFGSTVDTLVQMGEPVAAIPDALTTLAAEGETALYDALMEAAVQFTGERRRVLVLTSDGGDTVSASTRDDALSALEQVGTEAWVLALQTPETDRAMLEALAADGSLIEVSESSALGAAYESVALELTGRYRLVFAVPASRSVEMEIFLNGPDRVSSVAHAIDLGTGAVSEPWTPNEAPQVFTPGMEPVPRVEPAPDRFAREWTLPAGIGLLFVGAIAGLWLWVAGAGASGDTREQDRSDRSGIVSTLGERARRVGEGIADRAGPGAIDLALDRAGLAVRPSEFVVVSATAIVVGVAGGLVIGGAVGAILFGALLALAPRGVLSLLTSRRRRAFADQLEGTLQMISGSLRSGYGLIQAMSTVAGESEQPTAGEFNRVVVENRVGRTIEESLRSMSARLDNEDLDWVVDAIEIQHEVGGNLAEVLDTVASTIRERNQIRRQVKALSAEGRVSAIILLALPFAIAGLIAVVSPDYLGELTGTLGGRVMLGFAALLMIAGGAWIKKIVNVEF